MNITHRGRAILLFLLAYGILMPKAAFAYLDPGTGSFLLQMLIAGFFGFLVTIKSWWGFVAGYFAGLFARKPAKDTDES